MATIFPRMCSISYYYKSLFERERERGEWKVVTKRLYSDFYSSPMADWHSKVDTMCLCSARSWQDKWKVKECVWRSHQKEKENIYQKLPSIRPSISIKPLNSNPHLILHLPFVNNIWGLFSMFRYYILNSKTGCCIIKLLQHEFAKCRPNNIGLNSILIFWNKHHNKHQSSSTNDRLDVYSAEQNVYYCISVSLSPTGIWNFKNRCLYLWIHATWHEGGALNPHVDTLKSDSKQWQPLPLPKMCL